MERAQAPLHAAGAPSVPKSVARPAAPATSKRWMILAVLFMVTTINYADRATISIAGPELKKALGLSPVEMGYVFSAFAWSYVLAQLPGGWLLDRFGSKITYFFSIFLWSLFTLFTGFVGFFAGGAAVALLFALRFAVGTAEAPSFPGNSRITSAWFPTHERGLASPSSTRPSISRPCCSHRSWASSCTRTAGRACSISWARSASACPSSG